MGAFSQVGWSEVEAPPNESRQFIVCLRRHGPGDWEKLR